MKLANFSVTLAALDVRESAYEVSALPAEKFVGSVVICDAFGCNLLYVDQKEKGRVVTLAQTSFNSSNIDNVGLLIDEELFHTLTQSTHSKVDKVVPM